ncbi:ABC transporter F family member 5-like [Carica papaya]|uniref:ABC transporter F family member 5-like n=1 Tax=Carica papaya TaxID=3649 RepID=UPI000B8C712B|nr:ABC transporter F family member 5-like [Carica papaya]
MGLATNLHRLDLRSSFFTTLHPCLISTTTKSHQFSSLSNRKREIPRITAQLSTISLETAVKDPETDIESLFSSSPAEEYDRKRTGKQSTTGASGVSSGVKLENISKSYKGVTVLNDVSWEVKKGDKVGLVGVNGAGKTTQLRIITGQEEPDSGNVIKAKPNMKIAFLSQEFEVSMSRTVKEEFMSAFQEEMEIAGRLERVQKAIEGSVEDLELMGRLLDEFDLLQRRAQAVDLDALDSKISRIMPDLGFTLEDSDRLVASFSSGWQMRMSLGKILLQV